MKGGESSVDGGAKLMYWREKTRGRRTAGASLDQPDRNTIIFKVQNRVSIFVG